MPGMYEITVPVYERMLTNLVNCLEKAEGFAKERNFDADMFVQSRLAVDMFPLTAQIILVSDFCCRSMGRLSDTEFPKFADDENTIADLYERIEKTLEFIRGFKPEQIDGTEDKTISFEVRGKTLNMTGLDYIRHFILPNLYFHITTTYNILRHNGVELGKLDYLGKPV